MEKEIHELLKIENDKTTIFTNKELKMIDDYILRLEKENKILRENAEHNDKVVDKVNWENLKLKEENKQLYNTIEELSQYQFDREEEDMMNYIIEEEEVFNDYSFMDEL